MRDIFERERLSPSQLRSVAQRRFDDAQWLRRSGRNARANAALYFGGFVIECMLKANMLERYPSMQRVPSPEGLSRQDRKIWTLIYRSHDLVGMLEYLPEVQRKLLDLDRREASGRLASLRDICRDWTIFARYSPHTAKMAEAESFLDRIRDLRRWLS